MDMNFFSATVILCSTAWLTVSQDGCIYKECSCSDESIQCDSRNLTAMPHIVKENLTGFAVLSIDDNKITFIPAKSLPANLTRISFRDNPIASIDDAAFDDSSTTLTSLYFTNTHFTKIPNAFGHLHSLSYLSISGASIVDWNENVMNSIGPSMETLILNNVGLTAWPSWLQSFSMLGTLEISGSGISSIPDNALDNVSSTLNSLSLYDNLLTFVPKALSKLNNLQMLLLYNNQISNVSWLPSSDSLSTLTLDYNAISNAVGLSEALRPLGDALNAVDITNNQLTAIPDLSFLMNIEHISLTYNKISDTLSGALPPDLYACDLAYNSLPSVPRVLATAESVTNILLSWNNIKEIHASDFHSQTISVDVSYNLITALTNTSFQENSGIETLLLNNNPITQISTGAMNNLPNLVQLNLQSTQLTRLSLALGVLTKLSNFDVRNSPLLVCTCMESGLADWIMNIGSGNVLGDCGQSSVYYFFSTLSPLCPKGR